MGFTGLLSFDLQDKKYVLSLLGKKNMHLVRCGAITGFESLLYKQGVDPVALLAEYDITSSQLRNPDTYISYLKMAQLLELASERSQDPFFGLRLAASQDADIFGELGHALSVQPSYDNALEYLNQHLHLHAQGAYLQEQQLGDYTRLEFSVDFSEGVDFPQLKQMSIGQMSKSWAESVDDGDEFTMHLMQSNSNKAINRVNPFNLTNFVFDSDFDGIQFPSEWLEHRFKTEIDPTPLRKYLQQRVDKLEENHPQRLQDQLRFLLTRALASGDYSVQRMASLLDLHPRILQKRLQNEGASYSQVLRQTREDIACQNLKYGCIGITDLALQLGYAEVAIFSRHFKRWTGLSPRAWRQQHEVVAS